MVHARLMPPQVTWEHAVLVSVPDANKPTTMQRTKGAAVRFFLVGTPTPGEAQSPIHGLSPPL